MYTNINTQNNVGKGDGTYSKYRWFMLSIGIAAMFCTMMITFAFSPLIGVVATDLKVDVGTASFGILGLNLFSTAIGVLVSGFLVDKLGVTRVLLTGMGIVLVSTCLFPILGHSLGGVIVIRVLEALGGSVSLIVAPIIASTWFPPRDRGVAMGLFGLVTLGMLFSMLLGPLFVQAAGSWQMGTLGFAAVILVFFIYMIIVSAAGKNMKPPVIPENEIEKKNDSKDSKADFAVQIFKNPMFWIGIITMCCCNWATNTFNDMGASYLALDPPMGCGYGSVVSGRLASSTFVGSFLGMLIGGILVSKLFKGKSTPLILVGFVGFIIFLETLLFKFVYGSVSVVPIWVFFIGFFGSFTSVGNQCFAVNHFSSDKIGRVFSIWTCAGNFAGSVGTMIGSLALHVTNTYRLGFVILGIVALAGAVLSIIGWEKKVPGKNIEKGAKELV